MATQLRVDTLCEKHILVLFTRRELITPALPRYNFATLGYAMTEVLTTRVRVFAPDEFARPAGWPDEVGIAVLLGADEPEIFPVHQKETGAEIVARLGALSGRDLRGSAFFPPLDGHPECDLSFSTVARLRAGIESFLMTTPDAVEEAADFFVNFGFAADEGLNLSSLVRAATAPVEVAAILPVLGSTELPGYASLDAASPNGAQFIWALLWPSPTGELVLLSNPADDPFRVSPSDVLVKEDGTGLALRRSGLGAAGKLPGYIMLPPGCIGFDPPASGSQVVIVTRDRHFLVTPVPAWTDCSSPDDLHEPDVVAVPILERVRRSSKRLMQSVAAVICVAVTASAFSIFTSDPTNIARSEGPVPSLRAELFQ